MTKKTFFWMPTLILLISAASVNSQVTIGSTDDPHGGAVLDLSRASGSSVGFLLPRVSLTNVDTWQIGGVANQGVGMVVYNTNEDVAGGDGSGIYVWNGSAWTRIWTGADNACPRVVKDSESNAYSIGYFGVAGWWMTENLRSTKNDLYELTANSNASNAYDQKYYWYPNNNKTTFDSNPTYGLLYTWTAASGRTGADTDSNGVGVTPGQGDIQGICPTGWHLPSDYEWNQLEEEIAKNGANVYSTTAATTWDAGYSTTVSGNYRGAHGQKMKSTTPVNGRATNGTSKSRTANGFDALLVGDMYSGSAPSYDTRMYFWSSSSYSSTNAWRRYLYYDNTGVYRNTSNKGAMYSVRCKKNDN
jgi:uncharacterized protein (TIGR02145 family)